MIAEAVSMRLPAEKPLVIIEPRPNLMRIAFISDITPVPSTASPLVLHGRIELMGMNGFASCRVKST